MNWIKLEPGDVMAGCFRAVTTKPAGRGRGQDQQLHTLIKPAASPVKQAPLSEANNRSAYHEVSNSFKVRNSPTTGSCSGLYESVQHTTYVGVPITLGRFLFLICSTNKRFFLRWVQEVRTTKS
jgi:hypothetical protein